MTQPRHQMQVLHFKWKRKWHGFTLAGLVGGSDMAFLSFSNRSSSNELERPCLGGTMKNSCRHHRKKGPPRSQYDCPAWRGNPLHLCKWINVCWTRPRFSHGRPKDEGWGILLGGRARRPKREFLGRRLVLLTSTGCQGWWDSQRFYLYHLSGLIFFLIPSKLGTFFSWAGGFFSEMEKKRKQVKVKRGGWNIHTFSFLFYKIKSQKPFLNLHIYTYKKFFGLNKLKNMDQRKWARG